MAGGAHAPAAHADPVEPAAASNTPAACLPEAMLLPALSVRGTRGSVGGCWVENDAGDGTADVLLRLHGVPREELWPASDAAAAAAASAGQDAELSRGRRASRSSDPAAAGPAAPTRGGSLRARVSGQPLTIEQPEGGTLRRLSESGAAPGRSDGGEVSPRKSNTLAEMSEEISPRTQKLLTSGIVLGSREGTGAAAEDDGIDIEALFRMIDADESGTLEVGEIVDFMQRHPQWQDYIGIKSYTDFLEIMDADGSGHVDRSEFVKGLRSLRSRALQKHDDRMYQESLKEETESLRAQLTEFMQQKRSMSDSARDRADDASPTAAGGAEAHRGADVTDRRGKVWRRGLQQLGKGAFGEVWLAMDELGSLVAMKTLRLPQAPSKSEQSTTRSRRRRKDSATQADEALTELLQEVGLLCELRHNNIVSYFSSFVDVHAGTISIIMEYLSGGSLMHCLNAFGMLPRRAVRRYVRDSIRGLSYLHEKGVVHRDMKPHNVLLHKDGVCKLTDFGTCAKLASALGGKTGGPIGTPLYMSPEAAKGAATKASDVWGVGVTLLQLLTGVCPWDCEAEGRGAGPDEPRRPTPPGDGFNIHTFLFRLSREEHMVPIIMGTLDAGAAAFARKCCSRDEATRPQAADLVDDEFLRDEGESKGWFSPRRAQSAQPVRGSSQEGNRGGGTGFHTAPVGRATPPPS